MVIAELNDYIVPFIEAEKELALVKKSLLENAPPMAYGHILTALTTLRHAKNIIAASIPSTQADPGVELQQHKAL